MSLTFEQVQLFRHNGYLKLKDSLPQQTVETLKETIWRGIRGEVAPVQRDREGRIVRLSNLLDRDPIFRLFLNRNTILWMVGWLILCVVLTYTGTWKVGNAAHIAGLTFGFLLGFSGKSNRLAALAKVGAGMMIAIAVMTAVYMPWSKAWRCREMLNQFDLQY